MLSGQQRGGWALRQSDVSRSDELLCKAMYRALREITSNFLRHLWHEPRVLDHLDLAFHE